MNPVGIIIERPKSEPRRLRPKGKPRVMADGNVRVICKDENHYKHWISITPAMLQMLIDAQRENNC